MFSFEESRAQLGRNALSWGVDYPAMEAEGKLRLVCKFPEASGLEDLSLSMQSAIEEFQPARVAVDSLSALERISSVRSFREFVLGLAAFLKERQIAGLFTATTPTLLGGPSITEAHISTLTDTIILLRYVEIFGEMRRGITVLKMRGSKHVKDIREFNIDDTGMHIGNPFRGVTGILAGAPRHIERSEVDRLQGLFPE